VTHEFSREVTRRHPSRSFSGQRCRRGECIYAWNAAGSLVSVEVSVEVSVGVSVEVSVGVSVEVSVEVSVGVSVEVSVEVSVGVSVGVSVEVSGGVPTTSPPRGLSMISCASSRRRASSQESPASQRLRNANIKRVLAACGRATLIAHVGQRPLAALRSLREGSRSPRAGPGARAVVAERALQGVFTG
jgi:hypothetical protein